MFLTYQASDFNNWEKLELLLYIFIILNGRFSFKLNFILGWNSTRFIQDEIHVETEIFSSQEEFHPGWDLVSVTCKCTLNFFLVSLKYREIITIKTLILYKKSFFFIKSLENKKKKLALTSIYCVSQEIWLGNSKKLICIDQSRFYIFSYPQEFKNV